MAKQVQKNKKNTQKASTSVKKVDVKAKSSVRPKKEIKPVVDDAAVDAFIMEVDDEVKNDNFKAFFNKYGLFIILFVAIVLSATVSFETIKNWRNNQFKAKTDTYLAANSASTPEQTLAALEKVASGNYGIYSELARIQIADVLFDEGKDEDALNMLESLAANDELNPRVRNLASVKLAARKVDTASFSEIEVLLTPVIASDDAWAPIAKEYLALSAIQDGQGEKARELYQEILQDSRTSDEFRTRIQDMMSAISDITPER